MIRAVIQVAGYNNALLFWGRCLLIEDYGASGYKLLKVTGWVCLTPLTMTDIGISNATTGISYDTMRHLETDQWIRLQGARRCILEQSFTIIRFTPMARKTLADHWGGVCITTRTR